MSLDVAMEQIEIRAKYCVGVFIEEEHFDVFNLVNEDTLMLNYCYVEFLIIIDSLKCNGCIDIKCIPDVIHALNKIITIPELKSGSKDVRSIYIIMDALIDARKKYIKNLNKDVILLKEEL